MMQPALQARVSAQLTVTPQLQQAIGLLQLSSQELELELRNSLENNVFLEAEDLGDEDEKAADDHTLQESGQLPDDWPVSSAATASGPLPEPDYAAPEADLKEHLAWQLSLSSLSERDRFIAAVIIDALDDDGYLAATPAALLETLAQESVSADEFEAVRQYVLQFDPVGCGALELAECLALQIDGRAACEVVSACARALIRLDLADLAEADSSRLAERLEFAPNTVSQALELIRSLQPYPGRRLSGEAATTIVPDVLIRRRSGRWVVELNQQVLPRLRLNRLYEGLMAESRQAGAHAGMTSQLQEARWLVKSVQMRNETLLKVAAAIMQHQHGFLERGELAMKPMVLREIAEAVGMHESTVSRVTTRKYIQTPRGNFELKYFFSSRLATRNGSSCSGTAVRALVRRLIEQEEPLKPLSDGQLAKLLAARGVRIARRTVAKYREALDIPPLAERQALARNLVARRAQAQV